MDVISRKAKGSADILSLPHPAIVIDTGTTKSRHARHDTTVYLAGTCMR